MTYWSLLAARGINPDPFRVRSGGRPEISADEVRLALRGLDDRPFCYGMAAFLRCMRSFDKAVGYLDAELMDQADQYDWIKNERDRDTVWRLAEWVMRESIETRARHETYAGQDKLPAGSLVMRCPACRGKGVQGADPCPTCYRKRRKGSDGRLIVTDAVRMDAIGVKPSPWRHKWQDRYAFAVGVTHNWEGWAIAHVNKRLRLV